MKAIFKNMIGSANHAVSNRYFLNSPSFATLALVKKLFLLTTIMCSLGNILHAQQHFSLQNSFTNRASGFYTENNKVYIKGAWQDTIGRATDGLQEVVFFKDSLGLIPVAKIMGEQPRLNHLIHKSSQTGYVGIGFEKGCRYLASGNYYYHFDNDFAQNRKQSRINYFFRNIPKPIKSAFFIDDITLVLTNHDLAIAFNIQSGRTTYFNDTLLSYKHCLPFADGFVVIENDKFHLFNEKCNVVGTQLLSFEPTYLIKLKTENGFIALAKQKLAVLNRGGSEIYEHGWDELKTSFDSLKMCFYHKDTFNLVGFKDGNFQIAQTNDQFSILSLCTIKTGLNRSLIDILVKGNRIYALLARENERQPVDELFIAKRKQLNKASYLDLELRSVFIDSVVKVEDNRLLNTTVFGNYLVKNNTSDTVFSFFSNWQSGNDSTCRGAKKGVKRTKTLLPGAQDTFNYAFKDSFLTPEIMYELCINISSPNGRIDSLDSNNTFCAFTFLPKLSVKDYKLPKAIPSYLKAGEAIDISGFENVLLVDMQGIIQEIGNAKGSLTIPLNFATGLYVLVFQYESDIYRKRIYIVN